MSAAAALHSACCFAPKQLLSHSCRCSATRMVFFRRQNAKITKRKTRDLFVGAPCTALRTIDSSHLPLIKELKRVEDVSALETGSSNFVVKELSRAVDKSPKSLI